MQLGLRFVIDNFGFWFSQAASVNALAYIDPTTTAMVAQIVAGAFISLGVGATVFRRKLSLFFKNIWVKSQANKIKRGKNDGDK